MPMEGLRAWIGEVERKLGMRTRVFLVLSLIALGGAGAAIYLAVDARESSVSESDVQALQEKLEAQIAGGAAGAPVVPEEPVEPAPGLETEPAPEPEPEPAPQPQPKSGGDEQGGATGSTGSGAEATIKGSLEQTERRSAQPETEQAEK